MMIGVLVKTNSNIQSLPKDWMPDPIDAKLLEKAFKEVLGYSVDKKEFCYDKDGCLIYLTIDNLDKPLSVSFNCTLNAVENKIIGELSSILKTKIYDAESGDFIEV